ncbi:unnamed protein product [Nippostrongylus brasiliensis]|uniref:Uncharacterized protein n=1 Tax=Nippostrongylus brasiliensis TaxID=27835 RepID=A0A0N4YGA7_NIPBR|nr:unnamed protein product [Nippostrongylus brasiliensis]
MFQKAIRAIWKNSTAARHNSRRLLSCPSKSTHWDFRRHIEMSSELRRSHREEESSKTNGGDADTSAVLYRVRWDEYIKDWYIFYIVRVVHW